MVINVLTLMSVASFATTSLQSNAAIHGLVDPKGTSGNRVILGRLRSDPQPDRRAHYQILAQTSLKANGAFALPLSDTVPTGWPTYPMSRWSCDGHVRISDSGARFLSARLYLDAAHGGGTLITPSVHPGVHQVLYWYVTRPTTVMGRCAGNHFSLVLRHGWNVLQQQETGEGLWWSSRTNSALRYTLQRF